MSVRILLAGLLLACIGVAASAALVDSVGLRVFLPLGNQPLIFGLEIVRQTASGAFSATVSLNGHGQALLLATLDVPISESENGLGVRFTTGLYYFEPGSLYPLPLFGGGLSYRDVLFESVSAGVAGEIVYPFALTRPLLSLSGGWSPR